jgi:hypothetical protein
MCQRLIFYVGGKFGPSVVGIAQSSYRLGYGLDSSQDNMFHSSPQRPSTVLSSGYRRNCCRIKGLEREAEHSSRFSSQIMNIRSST